jgi:hypothetical protein
MHREIIHNVKLQLKDAVAEKIGLTRERVAYKASSRGIIPEDGLHGRRAEFNRIDSLRSWTKEHIRHLHLAYGYLRGQDYRRMEPKCGRPPCESYIIRILEKLEFDGSSPGLADIQEWIYGGTPSIFSRSRAPVQEVAA